MLGGSGVLGRDALGFSLRVAIALDAERADGAIDKGCDIECGFGGVQGIGSGEERGRFGLENRAAIVKGLLGDVVGADATCDFLDFELVVANERAIERQLRDGADGLQILKSLRGYLAETVAGDYAFAVAAEGDALRDAQH